MVKVSSVLDTQYPGERTTFNSDFVHREQSSTVKCSTIFSFFNAWIRSASSLWLLGSERVKFLTEIFSFDPARSKKVERRVPRSCLKQTGKKDFGL